MQDHRHATLRFLISLIWSVRVENELKSLYFRHANNVAVNYRDLTKIYSGSETEICRLQVNQSNFEDASTHLTWFDKVKVERRHHMTSSTAEN